MSEQKPTSAATQPSGPPITPFPTPQPQPCVPTAPKEEVVEESGVEGTESTE